MTSNSRFVFRFVLMVAGVETTYWFATRGLRTSASDSPPLLYIEERVHRAGGYSRSLWGNGQAARVSGAVQPSFGVVTLANADGALDALAAAAPGGAVTCWYGDDSLAFADYTQVYTARVHSVLADFDLVHIRQRDRLQDLGRPILTATFTGAGGLEGPPGLQTRKKPLVFGEPGMVPLIQVDALRQVYYVQANATSLSLYSGGSEFGHVFEGGVPITHAGGYVFDADLLGDTTAPAAGAYRYWAGYGGDLVANGSLVFGSVAEANSYTKGPLYVRLGTPPVLGLRIGASGLLQNERSEAPRAWRFTDLCNRAGLSDVWPGDLAPMGGLVEDFDAGNRYIAGDETYLDVMNDRAAALHGAFGFDRLDKFWCVRLTDPADGADAVVYAFDGDNARDFARVAASDAERPVWQVNVRAGKAYPDSPAELASAEMRDLLQRDPWLVAFAGSSSQALDAYPGATVAEVEIQGHHLADQAAQLDYVTRFGRLYGCRRELIKLKAVDFGPELLTIPLHAKVTLTLERFGMAAGVTMRVVGIEADLDARTVGFTLWGGAGGTHYWALTGGSFPAGAGDPGGSGGSVGKPPNWATAIQRPLGAFSLESYAAQQYSAEADHSLGDIESVAEVSDPPALMFYEGENLTPAEAVVGNPLHERTQFLARLDTVTAETFESYSDAQTLIGEVLTHNSVSCTVTGGGAVCSDDTTHGRFNTTTSGAKWMDCNASASTPVTLSFSPAIAALGCYMPDFGDFAGQVSAQLTPSGSTADQEWQLVSLMLDGEGANNSTTVTDRSRYGHVLTAAGNAKLTTTTPKYGTACMAFDGTGDYFSIPYHDSLSFNGKEFTIEGWARLDTTVASGLCLIDFRGSGSGSSSWQPFVNASTRSIGIWSGSATVLASASNAVPAMGTWFHWAIERSGTTTKIYINGAQVSSGTFDPLATHSSGIRIGLNQAGTNGWNGAMDEIRFTRRARYGGAFTAPAAALPIVGDPMYEINHTVNAASGALYFWGFVSTADTYTQVRFYSSSIEDVFGIDDLVFCAAADVL